MSEWKECILSDIADIIPGYAFKGDDFGNAGTTVIKIKDITPPSVNINSAEKIDLTKYSSSKLDKFRLRKGEFVIAMTGATIGKIGKLLEDTEVYINQRVAKIQPKSDVVREFVYFSLLNNDFDGFIQNNIDSHSAQENISHSSIGRYSILLPPLPEQKAIAEILSSLDDKIDLLHRQNKTLEAMAEALFRQWFVEPCKDELPEGWEISNLSDIAEVQNGYSFSSNDYIDYNETAFEVLKMGHIEKGGGLRSEPKRDYVPKAEKLSKYILNKNDIVMAMTDMKDNVVILGVPALVDKRNHYVLNQRVARIFLRTNELLLNNYLLYIQLKDPENIAILQSKANSGVQVNLTTQTIKDIQIIVPSMNFQMENTQILVEIYNKKEANHSQIRILEKLRDTLLPKLMSGGVKVAG